MFATDGLVAVAPTDVEKPALTTAAVVVAEAKPLDDDSFLIAECLTWEGYARDERSHGTFREKAETALAIRQGPVCANGLRNRGSFRLPAEERCTP